MGRLALNDEGWRLVSEGLCTHQIAERLGIGTKRVERILTHASGPSTKFVAASLLTFPMGFSELFQIDIS